MATDLFTERYKDRPEEWERARVVFNIFADRIENVPLSLAKRILADQKNDAAGVFFHTGKSYS